MRLAPWSAFLIILTLLWMAFAIAIPPTHLVEGLANAVEYDLPKPTYVHIVTAVRAMYTLVSLVLLLGFGALAWDWLVRNPPSE